MCSTNISRVAPGRTDRKYGAIWKKITLDAGPVSIYFPVCFLLNNGKIMLYINIIFI